MHLRWRGRFFLPASSSPLSGSALRAGTRLLRNSLIGRRSSLAHLRAGDKPGAKVTTRAFYADESSALALKTLSLSALPRNASMQIEGGGMAEIPLAYRGEMSYHLSVTVGRAYE